MSARSLAAHLRRYPLWYAIGVVWLVGILALPIVKGTALADVFDGGGTGPGDVAAGPGTTEPPSLGSGSTDPIGTVGDLGSSGGDADVAEPDTVPSQREDDDSLEIVPPELLDLIFDALPPLVLPAIPRELEPITHAVAPLVATGCSGLGLASVVVAVAAQTVEGVPLERLLPYLAPASTACAAFPLAPVHTVCAADQPLIIDLGGLTNTPPILGLGIDQLRAFETLMANQFGTTVPSLADALAAQLDCELVS